MHEEEITRRLSELRPRLYALSMRYLSNPEDRQDAVAQCMYKVWTKRHSIRSPEYFGTWVFKILINECRTIGREKQKTPYSAGVEDAYHPSQTERLLDADLIERAMQQISDEDKQVIYLRFYECYTYREISAMTNMPIGTVVSKARRSLHLMREYLTAG